MSGQERVLVLSDDPQTRADLARIVLKLGRRPVVIGRAPVALVHWVNPLSESWIMRQARRAQRVVPVGEAAAEAIAGDPAAGWQCELEELREALR
jgi:hypothetical protein